MILRVNLVGERRGRREFDVDKGIVTRTYHREYQVVSDSADDDEAIVARYGPGILRRHPTDLAAGVNAKEATLQNVEEPANGTSGVVLYYWKLLVDYTTGLQNLQDGEGGGGGGGGGGEEEEDDPNLLNTDPTYEFGFERMQIAEYKDVNGKPFLNTAGDPFTKPQVRQISVPTTTIRINKYQNVMSTSEVEAFVEKYALTVNSLVFRGKPAETVLVMDITATPQTWTDKDGDESPYYALAIKLGYRAEGWKVRILSVGLNALYEVELDAFEKMPIVVNGVVVKTPQLLDADGKSLANKTLEEIITGDLAYYIPYDEFKVIDISEIDDL
jgi:hypothetical protein